MQDTTAAANKVLRNTDGRNPIMTATCGSLWMAHSYRVRLYPPSPDRVVRYSSELSADPHSPRARKETHPARAHARAVASRDARVGGERESERGATVGAARVHLGGARRPAGGIRATPVRSSMYEYLEISSTRVQVFDELVNCVPPAATCRGGIMRAVHVPCTSGSADGWLGALISCIATIVSLCRAVWLCTGQ